MAAARTHLVLDDATLRRLDAVGWRSEGALAAEAEGQISKAVAYYRKVVAVGETSLKARAESKIEELK